MRVRVHRGTREIGGSCVEVEAAGTRIVLDLGLPLDGDLETAVLPDIAGLQAPDPSLVAVVLSHGHRDHWGLLPKLAHQVPLVLGAATERIMRAAAPFVPGGYAPEAATHLQDRKAIDLGPFTITPYLVDHSGFDAYAILVEADGRRLFYSGDLRAHGRKSKLFGVLLRRPPEQIDLMLMEGSSLGRLPDDGSFETESDLEELFLDRCRTTSGAVLVACSAQNIDRVVTIYRAAKRSGRQLVVDAYAAEILKATGYASIPKPADDWADVKVYIPQRQRVMLKKTGLAPLVESYKGRRIWPEHLVEEAGRSVFLIRPWMMDGLDRLGALADARVIWSQWNGYLRDGPGAAFQTRCQELGLPFEVIHTSGHASPPDLRRLAEAVSPARLAAVHTFERDRFPHLFPNVIALDDGQWLEV
jgi:ribonuclease J